MRFTVVRFQLDKRLTALRWMLEFAYAIGDTALVSAVTARIRRLTIDPDAHLGATRGE